MPASRWQGLLVSCRQLTEYRRGRRHTFPARTQELPHSQELPHLQELLAKETAGQYTRFL
jgi:hypothetical protein